LFFISITQISMTGHGRETESCRILSKCGVGWDLGLPGTFRIKGGED
jgi:hypothetical protein